MEAIKVLAFDTGGTMLDWHTGLDRGAGECGAAHGVEHDWHTLANEYRRRSLRRMPTPSIPSFNIDDVHRDVLDELVRRGSRHRLSARRTSGDRGTLARARCLARLRARRSRRLRQRYVCVSFTILSLSLVIDVSRRNDDRLGCGDPVRDAARLQAPAGRLSAHRGASRALARRNPDGGVPQFRPRCGARRTAIARPSSAAPTNGDRPARPIRYRTRPATSWSPGSPNSPMLSRRKELIRGDHTSRSRRLVPTRRLLKRLVVLALGCVAQANSSHSDFALGGGKDARRIYRARHDG